MGEVVGLPVREQERYVDRAELARLLGVSASTVKRWQRAGMPSECWGMRVRRYLPSQCVAWVRTRRIGLGSGERTVAIGEHSAPA